MEREEHWAAFCKTGSVAEYLAYKSAETAGGKEAENASVDRRNNHKGKNCG